MSRAQIIEGGGRSTGGTLKPRVRHSQSTKSVIPNNAGTARLAARDRVGLENSVSRARR